MKKCINLSIGKTTIKKEIDDNPDLSFYGEYTDKIEKGVIIREHDEFYEKIKTGMERDSDGTFYRKAEPEYSRYYHGEYTGFKPYAGGENVGTKEYYQYGKAEYDRMESYNNGHWCMIGIIVKTDIKSEGIGYTNEKYQPLEVFNSLWGIESDSGDKYFDEIISDLKAENKAELLKLGFSESEIDESLNNAEEVE